MERPSPANSDHFKFAGSLPPSAYLGLEISTAANPVQSPGSEDEALDGCCVQVEVATADEDLSPAEGGVA